MAKPYRPKAGVLALSLELYETLAPGLRQKREQWLKKALLPALKADVDCLFDTAVYRREDVDAAVSKLESQDCDAILIVLLTYAPSQITVNALKRTRLPIIIWNTQELYSVDQSYNAQKLTDNHGVHGTQDLGNVLLRNGVKFEYVTSHVSDTQATARIVDFLFAAAAVRRLRQARIGLLGYPFPGMGDFALDTSHFSATLGGQWINLPVEEYIARADTARPQSVRELVGEYRKSYELAPDLSAQDLELTARAELSLRGLIAKHKLTALTYQFTALGEDERTATLPFVAASRLMARGIGFAGEGDVLGAAGTAFLSDLRTPASFCEIFTIDYEGNSLFMSHMGEANVAMARSTGKIPLLARSTPITRTRGRQLVLVVNFEPGPATLCALTLGPQQRWRFIVSRMTVADFGPLKLEVPHFKLQPKGDVRDFLTAYAYAGGPHHSAVCFGNARERIKLAARMLDADFCEV